MYKFSIIIPVLHEKNEINFLIDHIYNLDYKGSPEIIVVDGSSVKDTIKAIKDRDVIKLSCNASRSRQMNLGAANANGDILIFLHVDTRLPVNAFQLIEQKFLNNDFIAGAFRLKFDSDKLIIKFIAMTANLRTNFTGIPYGDQAIFMKKEYFAKIGGYKDIPLMEDIEIMHDIKKLKKRIAIIKTPILTSTRRWDREGVLFTTIRNHIIHILYFLGMSSKALAKYYPRSYIDSENRDEKDQNIFVEKGEVVAGTTDEPFLTTR